MKFCSEAQGCVNCQLDLPQVTVLGFNDRLDRIHPISTGWIGADQSAPKFNCSLILRRSATKIRLRALIRLKARQHQPLRPCRQPFVVERFVYIHVVVGNVSVKRLNGERILPDVIID